jgi:hypothetical protein
MGKQAPSRVGYVIGRTIGAVLFLLLACGAFCRGLFH